MNANWLFDARKIPDEVMNYIRRIAVRAVQEKHHSPELIADVFEISRSSIYDWLRWYRHGGEDALDTRSAPGASRVLLPHMDHWLKETVLHSTPEDYGYDTVLWNLNILVELLQKYFDVCVSDSTVALHLHQMGLSCQKPCYRAKEQDPEQVADYLENKFHEIQQLAEKIGADIAFEDEAGVGIRTRSGRTWGEVNSPPEVKVTDQRGGYNVLSMITAKGELMYDLEEKTINGKRYIEFLEEVLADRQQPLIVIADNSSYHCSKEVQRFAQAQEQRIHLFPLPTHSPELNPAEQIWNEVKHRQLGKQPIKNKTDLHRRLRCILESLQQQTERVKSFFQLPDTKYAAI